MHLLRYHLLEHVFVEIVLLRVSLIFNTFYSNVRTFGKKKCGFIPLGCNSRLVTSTFSRVTGMIFTFHKSSHVTPFSQSHVATSASMRSRPENRGQRRPKKRGLPEERRIENLPSYSRRRNKAPTRKELLRIASYFYRRACFYFGIFRVIINRHRIIMASYIQCSNVKPFVFGEKKRFEANLVKLLFCALEFILNLHKI